MSWNAFLIGGSRVVFALAESGTLPAALARLHPRYKTPYVAVIWIGALCCLSPLFGRTILVWLINSGSFAVVAAYLIAALRRNQPDCPGHTISTPCRCLRDRVGGGLLCLYMPFRALGWPQEWGGARLGRAGRAGLVYSKDLKAPSENNGFCAPAAFHPCPVLAGMPGVE